MGRVLKAWHFIMKFGPVQLAILLAETFCSQMTENKGLKMKEGIDTFMESVEERAKMQLLAIEMAYNIKIRNKDDVARIIAAKSRDKSDVLMACTSISTWIARNGISGETVLPIDIVMQSMKAVNDNDRG